MGDFTQDTAVTRGEDGRLGARLSEDWAIWGPNGGYVASIALRAAGLVAPEGHRPAVFSCQYLSAAKFDAVEIEVEPVRQGRQAWCLNVAMSQAGKRFLQAQVWTTDRADGPDHADAKAPAVPGVAALKDISEHLPPGTPMHPFWAHIEQRPVTYRPFGDVDPRGAVSENWYRIRGVDAAAADAYLDGARALLLLDTMPWPTFHRGQGRQLDYIAPSLDLTVWLHRRATGSDWLMTAIHADMASGGLIHGGGRIWTEDGQLVATGGSQLLVVDRRG